MTASAVGHWDVGDKYATGVQKIKKIRDRKGEHLCWNMEYENSEASWET